MPKTIPQFVSHFISAIPKLSFRLGIAILLIEAIVLAVGGGLLVRFFLGNLEREMLLRVSAPGRLMQSGGLALSAVADPMIMRPLVGDGLVRAMLVGVNGVVLHSMDPMDVGRKSSDLTGQPLGNPGVRWGNDHWGQSLIAISPIALEPSGVPIFYLYVQVNAHELTTARREALLNIGAAILVTAILSTMIIHFLMRRSVLVPVRRMSDTVQRIGQGELAVRCPPALPGELGSLGQGLNAMADAIQANDRAIRDLNSELERKYEARTHDLQRELRIRVETEAQLRIARDTAQEALMAKSRFLAAASHDLRQPVHALRLLLSAAEGVNSDDGSEFQGLLEEMKTSVGNLADLLNALLDVSRLEAGVIIPSIGNIALQPLLNDLESQFQRDAIDADVRLHVVACSCRIRTDPILLKRILANLLSNAIKFSENGAVLLGCRRRGNTLDILVCDSGLGIQADAIDEIFDEFKQIGNDARQKAKGLGLGLSIVRRLCTLLAHPIRVSSQVGRGTIFAVSVPMAVGGATALAGPSVPPRISPRFTGRILLVDDDPNVQSAMQTILSHWGFQVTACDDGPSALAACQNGPSPDSLMVDFRLPGGMTGLDIVRRIRQQLGAPNLPAILITGEATPPPINGLSHIHLLHKPVHPDQLRAALDQCPAITPRQEGKDPT